MIIAEDYSGFWKCFLYVVLSRELIIDRGSSLTTLDSMITCDHDGHMIAEFLCLGEIVGVSRMIEIKCTECHHMVNFGSGYGSIRYITSCFRIWIMIYVECHNTKISQIKKETASRIQKVHNFKKTFDNR